MSILVSDGLHTSNDLLERLIAEHAPGAALTYNAPVVSMGPYLLKSGQ